MGSSPVLTNLTADCDCGRKWTCRDCGRRKAGAGAGAGTGTGTGAREGVCN